MWACLFSKSTYIMILTLLIQEDIIYLSVFVLLLTVLLLRLNTTDSISENIYFILRLTMAILSNSSSYYETHKENQKFTFQNNVFQNCFIGL